MAAVLCQYVKKLEFPTGRSQRQFATQLSYKSRIEEHFKPIYKLFSAEIQK